jgi:hypothetical protein
MRARTRVYRALLWLYPSRFRREYGASMTQLYTDLERGRAHPLRRALGELVITVPYQYWEAFMSTNPSTRALILVVATTGAVLASIAIGSAIIGLLLMLLLAWQLYATLRTRGWDSTAHSWWRLLLAGIGVEVALMAVYSLPGSWRPALPFAFYLTLGLILVGIVLMTTGVILAIAGIARRARRVA